MDYAASVSIAEMYSLRGEAFEVRFRIKMTNIQRALLEEMVRDPFSCDNLDTQGRLLVVTQKRLAAAANLTGDQAEDFASRLDNVVAETIVVIRRCLEEFPDNGSVNFQLQAAKRLGIPVA